MTNKNRVNGKGLLPGAIALAVLQVTAGANPAGAASTSSSPTVTETAPSGAVITYENAPGITETSPIPQMPSSLLEALGLHAGDRLTVMREGGATGITSNTATNDVATPHALIGACSQAAFLEQGAQVGMEFGSYISCAFVSPYIYDESQLYKNGTLEDQAGQGPFVGNFADGVGTWPCANATEDFCTGNLYIHTWASDAQAPPGDTFVGVYGDCQGNGTDFMYCNGAEEQYGA